MLVGRKTSDELLIEKPVRQSIGDVTLRRLHYLLTETSFSPLFMFENHEKPQRRE